MLSKMIKKSAKLGMIVIFSFVFLISPALASGEMSGTRSISDSSVMPGDTITVTIEMNVHQQIWGPMITENLPNGWEIIEKDNDDMTFNPLTSSWVVINKLSDGDSKTIVYDITVPTWTGDGTYAINGELTGRNLTGHNISVVTGGDSQVTVNSGGGNPTTITADFSANDTSGYAPLTVQFTDMSTAATSWEWDFDNDGVVDSTKQNPVHTYNETGAYTVKLTVSGEGGADTKTKNSYIKVTEEGNYNSLEASSVSLSATIIPAISIEVTPGAINFGALSAGGKSDEHNLNIKNKGAVDATVTAEVTDVARGLYEEGLRLDSDVWGDYYKMVDSGTTETTQLCLHVPSDYIGIGSMEGKLVFWAEIG
ncbi:PKD domain-containing protein [Methanolobus sp. ZRKC2]|uniref:PKD domain-containing protein n=1 Tax=Methanolobus sp. ZRKC2 TaxID=3125783 RepID=UPI0032513709